MKRVLLPLLLFGLLTTACKSKPDCDCLKRNAQVSNAAPAATLYQKTVKEEEAGDEVVQIVGGPATIFVRQGDHVRYMFYWPRAEAGSITIPLKVIHDGTNKDFSIRVQKGAINEWTSDVLMYPMCPSCTRPSDVRCCP